MLKCSRFFELAVKVNRIKAAERWMDLGMQLETTKLLPNHHQNGNEMASIKLIDSKAAVFATGLGGLPSHAFDISSRLGYIFDKPPTSPSTSPSPPCSPYSNIHLHIGNRQSAPAGLTIHFKWLVDYWIDSIRHGWTSRVQRGYQSIKWRGNR